MFNEEKFKNATDDLTRAQLFNVTRHYWVGVEDDMKLWVQENWSSWEEEKPKWLD
eukprot:CAMPEP_0118653060 /NCGR_PEP_ID=MMETSP0785-20121206/11639_1 /TAXON_ID=91992 /ORGANISM="Bolidomonas pacifica, Strain CCMP 1866" /LENGTH=54 /DNA_ID=CAMNT_0006545597 /DNA_START=82 /DNA_END=243 /DNA_ORIENTATION=+